jgi:hypothetical protein
MKRLPPQPDEWIDRSQPLAFTFEGRALTGFAGDTISSALAASGVRMPAERDTDIVKLLFRGWPILDRRRVLLRLDPRTMRGQEVNGR